MKKYKIVREVCKIMYDKIKKRWKGVTRKETYSIIKRTGGPVGKDRRGKELIFCWKKR